MGRSRKQVQLNTRQVLPIWIAIASIFAFTGFGIWFLTLRGKEAPTWVSGDPVVIQIAAPEQQRLRVFKYAAGSDDVFEFFVKRDRNNSVQVGFTRCRRCYRSGHQRVGNDLVCGSCRAPLKFVRAGQDPPSQADCTAVPIPFERDGSLVRVRADSVRASFARWFAPVLNQANH